MRQNMRLRVFMTAVAAITAVAGVCIYGCDLDDAITAAPVTSGGYRTVHDVTRSDDGQTVEEDAHYYNGVPEVDLSLLEPSK